VGTYPAVLTHAKNPSDALKVPCGGQPTTLSAVTPPLLTPLKVVPTATIVLVLRIPPVAGALVALIAAVMSKVHCARKSVGHGDGVAVAGGGGDTDAVPVPLGVKEGVGDRVAVCVLEGVLDGVAVADRDDVGVVVAVGVGGGVPVAEVVGSPVPVGVGVGDGVALGVADVDGGTTPYSTRSSTRSAPVGVYAPPEDTSAGVYALVPGANTATSRKQNPDALNVAPSASGSER
jgi:hypothetical protein